MNASQVVNFVVKGEECHPYCDICGKDETEVGTIVNYEFSRENELTLTLCSNCKTDVLDTLNSEPSEKIDIDLESGEYLVISS